MTRIIDREFTWFGHSWTFRFVPKKFHQDLGKVGAFLFTGQWEKAEAVLNQMQSYSPGGKDVLEAQEWRQQIDDLKRELMY